jgi:hypothetical protein
MHLRDLRLVLTHDLPLPLKVCLLRALRQPLLMCKLLSRKNATFYHFIHLTKFISHCRMISFKSVTHVINSQKMGNHNIPSMWIFMSRFLHLKQHNFSLFYPLFQYHHLRIYGYGLGKWIFPLSTF